MASIEFRLRATPPFPPTGPREKTVLTISGMDCGNCVRSVTDALQAVPGVAFAAVALDQARATVHWNPGVSPRPEDLASVVTRAGYRVEPGSRRGPSSSAGPSLPMNPERNVGAVGLGNAGLVRRNPWQRALLISIPAALLLLAADWVPGLGMNSAWLNVALILATLVQASVGWRFAKGAWYQLRAGSANMDTLVTLGSFTAYLFSLWGWWTGAVHHLFFTECVTILALITLGHWLEARMTSRMADAVRGLLSLAPQTAWRLRMGAFGTEPSAPEEVAVADLKLNEIVALRPGDRVPVDAEVVEGESAVDEAMLTGESFPVEKSIGSRLFAGTLNQSGRLVARITATGESTALAGVVAAVQRAHSSRASIQRLVDRISAVFVPGVVFIALLAGAVWWWMPQFAQAVHTALQPWLWPGHLPQSPAVAAVTIFCAVVIIACPCAMGLATPVALMAGVNAAVRRGILIRDAIALEKCGRITAVAFDKTGTLTTGRPEVVGQWAAHFIPGESAIPAGNAALAASLARPSAHPLSQALARFHDSTLPMLAWRETRGAGVQSLVAHENVGIPAPGSIVAQLGSLRWFKAEGIDCSDSQSFTDVWTRQGATIVGLAVGRRLTGLFALADPLKPRAAEVIHQLGGADRRGTSAAAAGRGLAIYLLSGDATATADAIAKQLRLQECAYAEVLAELSPEGKAAFLRDRQGRGERIAFVGDGINDAPALAQADLGIAVGRASDIAREAADIVLLNSDLSAVPEALALARATLRTIHQNLFWAFAYNIIAVPLAALGFISPVMCALSMGVSDLIVVGNAWRLARRGHVSESTGASSTERPRNS
ncbi:MAG: cation-translocating P-type ATPase [Pedosphaera sp.]|nr:cation-translocating P-type ATPase [Pedosphaera sp.]